jgi:hypothetical protein
VRTDPGLRPAISTRPLGTRPGVERERLLRARRRPQSGPHHQRRENGTHDDELTAATIADAARLTTRCVRRRVAGRSKRRPANNSSRASRYERRAGRTIATGDFERHAERDASVTLAANVRRLPACDSKVGMRHIDDGETVDPREVARVAGVDREIVRRTDRSDHGVVRPRCGLSARSPKRCGNLAGASRRGASSGNRPSRTRVLVSSTP